MKDMKASYLPAVSERAKEDHDFTGEIGKARKANRGERAETEGQSSEGHYFPKAAEFVESIRKDIELYQRVTKAAGLEKQN